MDLQSILHENQSPVQENRKGLSGEKESAEMQNGQKPKSQLPEEKRGKRQEVVINDSIRSIMNEYLEAYPEAINNPNNFIFFSSKGEDYSHPIKRGQAWKLITKICRDVGLSGEFGTHSLRKTWGYHARLNNVDLALIMHKLNHESIAYTRRY